MTDKKESPLEQLSKPSLSPEADEALAKALEEGTGSNPLEDPDFLAGKVKAAQEEMGIEPKPQQSSAIPVFTWREAPESLRAPNGEVQYILCANGEPVPLASNPKRTIIFPGQVYSIRGLSNA